MPARSVPRYTLHKPTGYARVRIDGKDHYLGVYGSTDSHQRYAALIAGRRVPGATAGLSQSYSARMLRDGSE